jgi:hypothetical protein
VSTRPEENKVPLSVRAVVEWEKRVSAQLQLIADLKRNGEPITRAESKLKRYQMFLKQLCIHREIIQELTTPDPYHAVRPPITDA